MRKLRGLSLFSGIGGLDLAFEWAGGEVSAFCEIEPYCQKVLRKHWPNVPLFEDIRELRGVDVGIVDVIYGGFPCQPFSVAGRQKGQNDSRYLWPEFSRLVAEIRPRWIVAENVPGILRLAAEDVCRDLERQGYSVGIWDFEAACVSAKHRRERIFFVAHAGCKLYQRSEQQRELRAQTETRFAFEPKRSGCISFSDTVSSRCTRIQSCGSQETYSVIGGCGRWEPEPGVDRVANGIPNRVDRLKALGNAVVPQQAYPVFKAIMEAEAYEQIQP